MSKKKSQQDTSKLQQETQHLLWKYLSQEDLQKLDHLSPVQIENHLAQMFNLNDFEIDLKQACFLDFYVTHYWWAAKERHFSHEQISSYFTIIYSLMNNLKEKHLKMYENIDEFRNMLSELNEKTKLFSDEQVKDIISHLTITFFQNSKIYEFLINENQTEISITREIEVECPKPVNLPYPGSLDEAMPENIYNKFILKIPDETTQEESAKEDLDKPESIKIPEEAVEEIHSKFEGLSLDEAKKIIFEVTNELITDLKSDLKAKVKDRESALLNELTKSQQTVKQKK